MSIIRVSQVWKQFRWHHQGRPRTLKEFVVSIIAPRKYKIAHPFEPFCALKDVSFEVKPGEMVGLIGDNGSGKSTILKLITGISKPTKGKIEVQGRISALLELGAGFHPDFTGRENVFLNASILGLRRREIEARFDDIVEFAELRDFIDSPVKTYSSGMYMRLAFAIAVNVNPDILVIDEVLAVGDGPFQQKCFDQINRFRREGKTILFVTHDLATVRDLCDRAIWLQKGQIMADGLPEQVIELYNKRIAATEDTLPLPGQTLSLSQLSFEGTREHEPGVWTSGDPFKLSFLFSRTSGSGNLELKIRILRSDGTCCYTNRHTINSDPGPFLVEAETAPMSLLSGSYILEVSALDGASEPFVRKHFFNVYSPQEGEGIAPMDCRWTAYPVAKEADAVHSL